MNGQIMDKNYSRIFHQLLPWMVLFLGFLPLSVRANSVIGPPPPQRILIITNGGGSTYINSDLPNVLACAGAIVTMVDVSSVCGSNPATPVYSALLAAGLPTTGAGLAASFDQVWDVRWPGSACSAITGPSTTPNSDEYLFKNYMANRGSLYEMFEYIDPTKYNQVVDFMNNVVSQTTVFPTQLGAVDPWILNVPGAVLAQHFDTNFNALGTAAGAIQTNGSGALPISQMGSGTALYLNTTTGDGYAVSQLTTMESFTGCQEQAPASNGKFLLSGDREFFEQSGIGTCPPTVENAKIIGNILNFLVKDPLPGPSITTSPANGLPCSTFTWTLSYTNTVAENNIIFSDTLPSPPIYVSSSPPPTSVAGNLYTWNLGSFANCTTHVVNITMQVPCNAAGGTQYVDSFTKSSSAGTTASGPATFTVLPPGMKVIKSANPTGVSIGQSVTYSMSVTNHTCGGPSAVIAEDNFGSGLLQG